MKIDKFIGKPGGADFVEGQRHPSQRYMPYLYETADSYESAMERKVRAEHALRNREENDHADGK